MKKLLALAAGVLLAAGVRAAVPSYSDFDQTYFITSSTPPKISFNIGTVSSPTGGITAAMATNIAAFQAKLATNVIAGPAVQGGVNLATNLASGPFLTNVHLGSATSPVSVTVTGPTTSSAFGWNDTKQKFYFQDLVEGNGGDWTNLLHGTTLSAGANISLVATKNADGSTNFQVTGSASGTGVTNNQFLPGTPLSTNYAGSGAILTNLLNGSFVTPQQFGAVGDATTDDTVALQAWLDYAGLHHLIAFLPPATGAYYKTTDTLFATNSAYSVNILGCGGSYYTSPMQARSRINVTGVAKSGLVVMYVEQPQIHDIVITCDTYDYSQNNAGLAIKGAGGTVNNCRFIHVGVSGFAKGFYLHSIADSSFNQCAAWANGDNVFCGTLGSDYANPYLENVTFESSALFGSYSNSIIVDGACRNSNIKFAYCAIGYPVGGAATVTHHTAIIGTGLAKFEGCEMAESEVSNPNALITATNAARVRVDQCNLSATGPRTGAYTLAATNAVFNISEGLLGDAVSGVPILEVQVPGYVGPRTVAIPQQWVHFSANSGSTFANATSGLNNGGQEQSFPRLAITNTSAVLDLIGSGLQWELYSAADAHFGVYDATLSQDLLSIASGANGGGVTIRSNLTIPPLTANSILGVGAGKTVKSVLLSGLTFDGTTLTATGTGAQTPWSSDIDGAGKLLTNVLKISTTDFTNLGTATFGANPGGALGTDYSLVDGANILGGQLFGSQSVAVGTYPTHTSILNADGSASLASGDMTIAINGSLTVQSSAPQLNWGTNGGTHEINVFSASNNVMAVASSGTDSASMIHIQNRGVQGPFFSFESAADNWGYGVASAGQFVFRHTSTIATDPVNGTNVMTVDGWGNVYASKFTATNGGLSFSGTAPGSALSLGGANSQTNTITTTSGSNDLMFAVGNTNILSLTNSENGLATIAYAGTRTLTHDSTHTVITNTATLTSSEWTAGSQKEWYNGAVTMTIDKTNGLITTKALEFSTNAPTFSAGVLTIDMLKSRNEIALNTNATVQLTSIPTSTGRPSLVIITNSATTNITLTFTGFSVLTNGAPTASVVCTNLDAKHQRLYLSIDCDAAAGATNGVATHFYNP